MTLRDAARSLAGRLVPRGTVNTLLRWTRAVVGPSRFDALMGRGHRLPGYRLLSGHGIEIGALHAPAPLPAGCTVTYVDAISTDEARRLFPEIDAKRLVHVDIVADLDRRGLSAIADGSMDFAIMNHVIEHVANPIAVIQELFRVVRPGGHVVVSAPDMRFSFDRRRALTSDEHLLTEFAGAVDHVTDSHYEDFVLAVSLGQLDPLALAAEIAQARARREHAHVWDSASFQRFLPVALQAAGADAQMCMCSTGDANALEHFSVWRKARESPA